MTAVAWSDWVNAIHRAVAGVPDNDLRRTAVVIRGAGLVVCAGNGGSSAIASHAAQAISKPDYRSGGGRPAVCLTDGAPALTAHANDGGWSDALTEAARPFLAIPGCVLLVISSSGRSENVVRLARMFADAGRPVISLTGFSGEPLRSLAAVALHVDSHDYEVVEPVHDALVHRIQAHLRTR